jgi:hypothetical protein
VPFARKGNSFSDYRSGFARAVNSLLGVSIKRRPISCSHKISKFLYL